MISWLDARARHSLGLALSDTTLHSATGDRFALEPRLTGDPAWPSLRDAFAALAAHGSEGRTNRTCTITLLPPLVALRFVQLPKMRDEDLTAVLSRSVQRYFPSVREAQIVSALKLEPVSETEHRYAVVAAPAALLFAIQSSARDAGFTVDAIVSAFAAWGVAAETRRGSGRGGSSATVAVRREDGGADVIRVQQGVPVELRRLRAADVASEVPHNAVRIETPQQDAARYAPRVRVLELMTDDIRARHAAVAKRKRWVAIAAGIAVILAGMGAVAWKANREANAYAMERLRIKPQADSALALQAELSKVTIPMNTLARVEEHGVRWTAIITELSENLPPDSYIETMRTSNDSLIIDVASANAARAIQSISASDYLSNVTPVGSIRRDVRQEDADDALERFTLRATLGNAAPLVPSPERTRNASRATGVFGARSGAGTPVSGGIQ